MIHRILKVAATLQHIALEIRRLIFEQLAIESRIIDLPKGIISLHATPSPLGALSFTFKSFSDHISVWATTTKIRHLGISKSDKFGHVPASSLNFEITIKNHDISARCSNWCECRSVKCTCSLLDKFVLWNLDVPRLIRRLKLTFDDPEGLRASRINNLPILVNGVREMSLLQELNVVWKWKLIEEDI